MSKLSDLTATELLAAFRAREASPVEAVESCLARMEALEPSVNAVMTLLAERCLEGAKRAAERWVSGRAGLLEGVPLGLKDVVATAGIRTAGGSKIYADHVPTESAAVVERLEAAGALVLAKLQTIEFAFGDNAHYGPTYNPWDLTRSPGASSSGSGAALAARELPLAVGTDTGGSIRIPASFCGVLGLKPTYGLVSRRGVMAQSWTLDHIGPMARTAGDVALMLTAMAGYDARDPTSARAGSARYLETLDAGVEGLRLGVPRDWFFDVCDPEVEAAVREAAAVLAGEGAQLVEIDLPHARLADAIGWTIMYAEFASLHEVHLDRLNDFGAGLTRELLASSQFVSAQDYLRALRARHLLQLDLEEAFRQVDALVVPGAIAVAPRFDDWTLMVGQEEHPWPTIARTTLIFNLAGVPALAVPSGFNREGLPTGLQVAARPFDDATVLRVAHAFQRATEHHLRVPLLLPGGAA